jgi:arylsulfatase A-like enzyme
LVRSNPGGTSIAAEDVTVAQVLKQAGYATGCFGKWGLGDINTPGVPWKHGFDDPVRLYHNDREVLLPGNANGGRGTYASDAMAGKALEFIRREKNRPFYCYLTPTVPHWEPLAPYRGIVKAGKPFAANSGRPRNRPARGTQSRARHHRLLHQRQRRRDARAGRRRLRLQRGRISRAQGESLRRRHPHADDRALARARGGGACERLRLDVPGLPARGLRKRGQPGMVLFLKKWTIPG